jgi:hypothetical protein
MTLKKSNGDRGQSAAEYFILTIIIVALVLFFARTGWFVSIKGSLDQMFNNSVDTITAANP